MPKNTYKAQCKAAAVAVHRVERQAFLDAIWAGLTFGEAQEQAGISMEAAVGIMDANTVVTKNYTLNKEVAW